MGVSELCHKTLDCLGAHPNFPARMFLATTLSPSSVLFIVLFNTLAASAAAAAPFVAVATDCGEAIKSPKAPILLSDLTEIVSPLSVVSSISFPFKKSPIL